MPPAHQEKGGPGGNQAPQGVVGQSKAARAVRSEARTREGSRGPRIPPTPAGSATAKQQSRQWLLSDEKGDGQT